MSLVPVVLLAGGREFLVETMGVSLIGLLVSGMLYGVTALQVLYYFVFTVPGMPPNRQDGWPLKLLVLSVLVFDTIHMMLISHTLYYYLVSHYNDPAALDRCVWSLLLEVLFNGLIALLVQSFLMNRIWLLSNRNIYLTGVACLVVLAEFGCICTFAINGLVHVETFSDLAEMKGLSITVNVLAVVSDLYIALALCRLLYLSKTGYQKSDTMVRKLSIYALNTGAVTSACALGSLISITAAPNTFLYIMFFFCIGRLYANSLLASLNMRPHVRNMVENLNRGSSFFDVDSGVKFAPITSQTTPNKCKCCHCGCMDEKFDEDKDDKDDSKRRSQSFSIHLSNILEEGSASDTCVSMDVADANPNSHSSMLIGEEAV